MSDPYDPAGLAPLWPLYGGHRRRVMEELGALGGARVGLVGAGSCLDLDLNALPFDESHLIDLRGDLLEWGVAFQEAGRGLILKGGVDVTGFLPDPPRRRVPAWRERVAAFDGVADATPLDGIASLCLLTQLIKPVGEAFWHDTPGLPELVAEVRAAHYAYLLRSVRPGGWALVLTDVVSSVTLPGLLDEGVDVEESLSASEAAGNHFTGVRRDMLAPEGLPMLARWEMSAPWIWRDTPDRARAVVALRMWRS